MDYSTGLPQINIPIYEVKSGSLSIPISLSYHASGRRVYDQDGAIALGWNLNAGGMISRAVHGAVDFGSSAGTFPFPTDLNVSSLGSETNANRLAYCESMMHFEHNSPTVGVNTWSDGEYDIFSYSFGDHNGKFFFKDNGTSKTLELLPYKPYTVTPLTSSTGLGEIDIVDDKGVFYQFKSSETTLQSQSSIETVQATTGYNLRKMISADKTDTITFIYGYSSVQKRKTVSTQISWNDKPIGFEYNTWTGSVTEGPTDNVVYPFSDYQSERLTEIDFKQGKVVFNLVKGTDKVDNIQIVNRNDEVIKIIQIKRSLLNRLDLGFVTNKLDNLIFKDKNNTTIENYSFTYYPFFFNDHANQDDHTVLNERFRDYWGYYNASGVYHMIPTTNPLQYIGLGNTYSRVIGDPDFNRSPNLDGLKSGMLQKIIYPTGGSTEFVYENNKYFSFKSNQITNGPGMRVSQVKTSDNQGVTTYKTYKYGDNENGYGVLDMEPDMTNMSIETKHDHYAIPSLSNNLDITYSYRNRTFYSDFISPLAELGERPIIYTTVTEYYGTPTENIGKTIYQYDYSSWAAAGMPAFETMTLGRKHIYNFNYWNTPSLTELTDYKSGSAIPQKKISNSYSTVTIETVGGMHVQRVHELDPAYFDPWRYNEFVAGSPGGQCEEPWGAIYANPLLNIYTYSDYQIPVGCKNLISSVQTLYNDDGSTTSNTTSYTYNSHQYVSQSSVNTSDAGSINTQITYPFDYSGNPLLTKMSTLNMLNYPVEQNELKNTVPVKGIKTNYYNFGTVTVPRIYPQTVDAKKGSNAYETRLRYLNYDESGNILNMSKENDVNSSYIWDYNNSYPVAEVKNGSNADIAFTSFEADGNGNWTGITSANVTTDINNSITGIKYYSFNGTSLSKTGLTSTNNYIVSYWSKHGQYSVTGTTVTGWPKSLRTVTNNGVTWTNWEHKVSGVSTISVSGTGAIDELRLYPEKAQVTTYTFTPLVGMTSQCDLDNRITYYEYDPYGRVKLIRDLNKNIIKTFSYQYNSTTP